MSQRMGIDFKRFFMKLVRKFVKMASFRKSTYELVQVLSIKRKNASQRRFAFNGEAGCAIYER